jgi:acylphosphatase
MIVSGRVQGVGFRYFVYKRAHELELAGWVRNRVDGSVEIQGEGRRDALESLVNDVSIGPRIAEVADVAVDWLEPSREFRSFDIRG